LPTQSNPIRLLLTFFLGTRYSQAGKSRGNGKIMPKLKTLFGDGCAVVVGLPSDFDLSGVLRSAKEVRPATAFAQRSCWNLLKSDIAASAATFSC
jgi:hypothetical protein